MGVTYEYFLAAGDVAASTVAERGLGAVPGPLDEGFVAGGPVLGPDPVVELTALEAILTGHGGESLDLIDRPDCGRWVSGEPDGMFVVTVARGTVDALLAADDATLRSAAQPWSQIAEFWGQWDPRVLLDVARAIRALFARGEVESLMPYVLISL